MVRHDQAIERKKKKLINDGHLARARRPRDTADHAPPERSQHANHTTRRSVPHSCAPTRTAACHASPSLSTHTFAPEVAISAFCELHAGTRDHDSSHSRACAYGEPGARVAARLPHGASLAAARVQVGTHAAFGAKKSRRSGGNRDDCCTPTFLLFCNFCLYMHCTFAPCVGRFVLTPLFACAGTHRLRA